jgi:hypothetical protein
MHSVVLTAVSTPGTFSSELGGTLGSKKKNNNYNQSCPSPAGRHRTAIRKAASMASTDDLMKHSGQMEYFSRNMEYFSRNMEYFSRNMEYFSLNMEYFSRNMEYFSRNMEYFSVSQNRIALF